MSRLILSLSVSLALLAGCSFRQRELGNVYRYPLITRIKGLDPALGDDLYSHMALKQVYEPLLQYHHLKRPYTLIPLLADSLPRISEDRLTYIFKIKKGIFFQDDPCFKGAKRELTAQDFVFSIKRLADIKVKSTGWWLFDSKIRGLNDFRKKSQGPSKTDYSIPVEGLSAPGPYTFVVKLVSPCPQLPYFFAMSFASAVPREAVEYYGPEFLNHPVGTGPFKLIEWRRGLRLKYVRNPDYHPEYYPSEGGPEDTAAGLLADAGKRLPLIDTLIMNVFVESQPMWLNFIRRYLDVTGIPKDNFNKAVNSDMALRPEMAERGIQFSMGPSLDLTYTCFNMEDSLLGKNVHLRRAMSYAWNVEKVIDLLYNRRAIPAHSPIPPGLLGYDAAFVNPYQAYDTERAKKELVSAGYPQGKGLPAFEYLDTDNTTSRQWSEKFVKEMGEIGIKIKVNSVTWPEFLKRLKTKQYQIAGAAWIADYPDPENFLQLLYGPNESPGTNSANYKNPEYDALYLKLLQADSDKEKLTIINSMKEIFVRDCPWIIGTHRLSTGLRYDWVKNYKYNDVSWGDFKYLRVDTALRNQRLREQP